jgi:hypothetical protein
MSDVELIRTAAMVLGGFNKGEISRQLSGLADRAEDAARRFERRHDDEYRIAEFIGTGGGRMEVTRVPRYGGYVFRLGDSRMHISEDEADDLAEAIRGRAQ